MIVEFPPVETADPESGLLAVGGDLDVASLELAYRSGVFPWPMENEPLLWFAPQKRAVLFFDELRVSQRLRRYLKTSQFHFRMDSNFATVIRACANSTNRGKQKGTWITEEMIQAYIRFHEAGFAHSFETYDADDRLVGGLYGVRINNFFAGESMFYIASNASKFALIETVGYLRSEGLRWMDVQMLTPLLSRFGAREIHRVEFMRMLDRALHASGHTEEQDRNPNEK